MRILALTKYGRLGATSRVRVYQYLPYLEARGIQVTVAPLLEDYYIQDLYAGRGKRTTAILRTYLHRLHRLLHSRAFDLVWLEKETFPWLPPWGERLLCRLNVPYIVDYDDAIFHNYNIHPRPAVRRLLGTKIDEVMRRAAIVVVGNDYLGEHALRAGASRVEPLPTVIDLERYHVTERTKQDRFTIGWIGTPKTAPYLQLVGSALAEVCRNERGQVVLVGSGPVVLEGVPTEIRPWSEATEATEIERFDVGIMPLPDAAWERGKCGYKLIQCMACGKPVVASPIGINRKLIAEEINGALASTPADWTRALLALRDDPVWRAQAGQEARRRVEQAYCLQRTAPRLLALLQEAAGLPRAPHRREPCESYQDPSTKDLQYK